LGGRERKVKGGGKALDAKKSVFIFLKGTKNGGKKEPKGGKKTENCSESGKARYTKGGRNKVLSQGGERTLSENYQLRIGKRKEH